MENYYDPNFYYTGEHYGNVVQADIRFDDAIDSKSLDIAVSRLRNRFPWFYVGVAVEGEKYVLKPNPLPVIIHDADKIITLGAKESNYHLLSIGYKGNRLLIEISHCLTDGAGLLPYVRLLINLYLAQKKDIELTDDYRDYINQKPSEDEYGDPWPIERVRSVNGPFFRNKGRTREFYDLLKNIDKDDRTQTYYHIDIPVKELLSYAKSHDGSINALMSTLIFKAIMRVDPDYDTKIVGRIAVNMKGIVGKSNNYHFGVMSIPIDYPPKARDRSIERLCTVTRGQIIGRSDEDNILWNIKKNQYEPFDKIEAIPKLSMKLEALKNVGLVDTGSFFVSYASKAGYGEADKHIEGIYYHVAAYGSPLICEVACVNDVFMVSFMQRFENDIYINAFCELLEELDIHYEIREKKPLVIAGVRYEFEKVSEKEI